MLKMSPAVRLSALSVFVTFIFIHAIYRLHAVLSWDCRLHLWIKLGCSFGRDFIYYTYIPIYWQLCSLYSSFLPYFRLAYDRELFFPHFLFLAFSFSLSLSVFSLCGTFFWNSSIRTRIPFIQSVHPSTEGRAFNPKTVSSHSITQKNYLLMLFLTCWRYVCISNKFSLFVTWYACTLIHPHTMSLDIVHTDPSIIGAIDAAANRFNLIWRKLKMDDEHRTQYTLIVVYRIIVSSMGNKEITEWIDSGGVYVVHVQYIVICVCSAMAELGLTQ